MGNSLLDPLRALRNLSPIPYSSPGQRTGFAGLFGRSAGTEAQMRAMGTNGTLFSMVDRITTAYSQVEWHLYRKAKSGKTEDRVEVTNHAALDLWNQPNPFMSGPSFRETAQQHEELVGEQWWTIATHEKFDIPLELWPVRPDRMEPIPDPKAFISGYEYTGPGGQKIPLGLDEVFFLRRPNPLSPYRGMGAVQTILCDLDASRYSSEWLRNFFVNDATPGGIIQVDKHLNDAQFNEARARWAEQHKGVRNAHRVAILENGLTWVDRAYTNKDMQFAELGDATRETIREALGFPKPMTGATDDINRSNADAGELVFARWLLVPRLMRVRALLNTRLLPMYGRTGEGLEFDFDSPVPEDVDAESVLLTARSSAASALVAVGFDPAGTLSAVGLPDIAFTGPRAPAAPLPPVETSPADAWRAATAGLAVEPEAAMRWVAVCVDDGNSCLAPEVRVTTSAGLVRAEDVTLDHELLTHTGQWVKPSRIVVSHVEEHLTRVDLADGRSLRLTWDHPVLVRAGEGFTWCNAGDLTVGSLVVDQATFKLDREVGGVDFSFGQSPYGVAATGQVCGLPAVDVGAQRVPVGAVRFDHEQVADQEVSDPGAYLDLGAVDVSQVFEGLADPALDAGLSVARSVAADRAVPLPGGSGRLGAESVATELADDDHGGPSARLGAVPARIELGVPENCPTSCACGVAPTGGVAACTGAVVVPVSTGDGNVELGAASGAGLRGPASPRGGSLGPVGDVVGVPQHALARAVSLAGPTPPRDLARAGLAERRREVRMVAEPRGLDGAAHAQGASLDRHTAVRTRLIHEPIVQVTMAQVVLVKGELYAGKVYDFTVPDDETFWAEGVLVHNCQPCLDNDGQLYRNRAAAYEDYPGGKGYVNCLGGENCRCTVVKRGKGGGGE